MYATEEEQQIEDLEYRASELRDDNLKLEQQLADSEQYVRELEHIKTDLEREVEEMRGILYELQDGLKNFRVQTNDSIEDLDREISKVL